MGERAEAIGAELRIESELGRGTRVVVTWRPENRRGVRTESRSAPDATLPQGTGGREKGV